VQAQATTASAPAATAPHNAAATWREARSGAAGFTTVKGIESGVLVSSQGNTWRAVRNGLITPYGGAVLIVVAAAIAVFYRVKGTIRLHQPRTGRKVARFSTNERRAHWLVAISFVCLAFTGIVLLFGKHIFLWLLGYTLFSWLGWLSKNVHIVAGFCFVVGVILLFALFWKDNLWDKSDAEWIRKAGGLASGEHVPSRRFNFGEKAWFWVGLTGFGLIMILSGLALTFPNYFDTRAAMQYAQIIHATSACLVIAMSLGHIYMGTIGMEGSYEAMRTGEVDESWAREHHEIWYEEEVAKRGGGGA
ncbi:MAG TPA: formate dehydrogenase subunit gamma, partial [Rhodocyclaceae bacterium]|nr:formate dehydrogenase subunit gamma [Rhodocyclaceae bacterium]